MIIQSEHLHVELKHGSTFELADARRSKLTCLAGILWITQHQQNNDWVLQPGQYLNIGSAGKVVISTGKENASFTLQPCDSRKHFLPGMTRGEP